MSEVLIQCSECQKPTPEDELTYDDGVGGDLCEDCYDLLYDLLVIEPVEVGDDEDAAS